MRVLLPFVCVLTACGDNLAVDPELDPADPQESDTFEQIPRLVPDICTARRWSEIVVDGRDVDLSVAPLHQGAAIFTVAKSGGPLRGFLIDQRGNQLGEANAGVIIRDDFKLTGASASYLDGRLITASLADGSVLVDMVRLDLGARIGIAELDGEMLAELPMVNGRSSHLATFGNKNGANAVTFDDGWQPAGAQLFASELAVRSLTAAQTTNDAMLSWSTDKTCHVRRLSAGHESSRRFPCAGGRIAWDAATQTGMLVYETDGRIMRSDLLIDGESQIATQQVLANHARSPRIAFDGARYWVSYLDAHDDIVVGYIEDDGSLASLALEGTQPMADAHELVYVNHGVWLFTVDDAGIGAQRACLRAAH